MSIHIESKTEDIAPIVLMPGDPQRATYIAENYLSDYKLVNSIRGQLAYTGFYKNKRITVFSSGMGIPSIGIYSFELYKFYNVKHIIRIGTAGALDKNIKMLDIVLATSSYSLDTFPLQFDGDKEKNIKSSTYLNNIIINKAFQNNININCGKIITSDVFDPYVDTEKFDNLFPKDNYIASEMEAFGLFYIANKINKNATCLLSIVDSKYNKTSISTEDRITGLNTMIELALESTLEIEG